MVHEIFENISLKQRVTASPSGISMCRPNDGIWAVADAAQELNVPVIIGVSEGERDYIGVKRGSRHVKTIKR